MIIRFITFLQKILGRIFMVFHGVSSSWLFFLMVLISIDVLSRLFFNRPLRGTPELVRFSLVIVAFLQLPYVLWKDTHVRSTMFYDKVGPIGKDIIDILAASIGMIVFIMLIRSSINPFLQSIRVSEFEGEGALRIPATPARAFLMLGSGFMVLQLALNAAKKIHSLVNRILGRVPT